MAILLNKRIGCESRTVPPLYRLRTEHGENRSLEIFPGRLFPSQRSKQPSLNGLSQKTYEEVFKRLLRFTEVGFVAEKRLRRHF